MTAIIAIIFFLALLVIAAFLYVEFEKRDKKNDAYGGLGSEMDTNSMNYNSLKL